MKYLVFLSLATFVTTTAFAGRCVPDAMGNMNFENRCEVTVTGSSLAECHLTSPSRYTPDYRGNYPGNHPSTYNPPYHTHPWERVVTGTKASACDVTLEDCKYFAFRQLEKYEYVNNCGDISVGKSVEYKFQTLNTDGTVADEVTGRMKK